MNSVNIVHSSTYIWDSADHSPLMTYLRDTPIYTDQANAAHYRGKGYIYTGTRTILVMLHKLGLRGINRA